ncbi:MAG: hypothetical protein IKO35_04125 [Elusimicrobiaceae bacterium]|nr:hypothetical protein [Elusimicrobiaceae bacterium]
MTVLFLILLFLLVSVYAVFFLFFKIIWVICKKEKNKWPFILSGICTVLLALGVVAVTLWGVNKVMHPFQPLRARIAQNPQPVYGVRSYRDPVYPFTLQLPDGMDFSEWIPFSGTEVKLGINTNVFKKDKNGNPIKSPVVLAGLLRQTAQVNQQDPFGDTWAKNLKKTTSDPRVALEVSTPITLEGRPGYTISGTAYTDKGNLPFWVTAFYQDGAIFYILASELPNKSSSADSNSQAKMLATSLQPLSALPQAQNE